MKEARHLAGSSLAHSHLQQHSRHKKSRRQCQSPCNEQRMGRGLPATKERAQETPRLSTLPTRPSQASPSHCATWRTGSATPPLSWRSGMPLLWGPVPGGRPLPGAGIPAAETAGHPSQVQAQIPASLCMPGGDALSCAGLFVSSGIAQPCTLQVATSHASFSI